MTPRTDRSFWWLAAARVYVGLLWLNYGTSKFEAQWARTEFLSAIKGCIADTSGPVREFLVTVVVPNQALFAQAIAIGETLVGIALVLGLFTNAGALGGMFLSLNYYVATKVHAPARHRVVGAAPLRCLPIAAGAAFSASAVFGRGDLTAAPREDGNINATAALLLIARAA